MPHSISETYVQIIPILVGLALIAAIGFYVSRPIVKQRRGTLSAFDIESLEIQREMWYGQIRELDLDHATGKTSDDDYQRIRAELVAQAANVLRKIDGAVQQPIEPAAPKVAAAAGNDVEALIAARRKVVPASAQASPAPDGDDIEAMIAARRKVQPVATARVSADQDVEALITARRKTRAPKPGDADIEAAIAAHRKTTAPRLETAALSCPNCGKPINADDVFCSKCGTALQPQASG